MPSRTGRLAYHCRRACLGESRLRGESSTSNAPHALDCEVEDSRRRRRQVAAEPLRQGIQREAVHAQQRLQARIALHVRRVRPALQLVPPDVRPQRLRGPRGGGVNSPLMCAHSKLATRKGRGAQPAPQAHVRSRRHTMGRDGGHCKLVDHMFRPDDAQGAHPAVPSARATHVRVHVLS